MQEYMYISRNNSFIKSNFIASKFFLQNIYIP